MIRELFSALAEAFFPFRCHACHQQTDFGTVLCDVCCKRVAAALQQPFLLRDVRCDIQVYSLSDYSSFISDAVKIIKYRPSRKLAEKLVKVCLNRIDLKELIEPDDVLVPVPMHGSRLAKRGFNQAEIIAELLVEQMGCRYSPAIVRTVPTRPQADCDEEERLTNLDNAFKLSPGLILPSFAGKKLVLVDDVATTGTTLQKCADALCQLEPASVRALVITHSFRRSTASHQS